MNGFVIMQHQINGNRYMFGTVYPDVKSAKKMADKLNSWDNPSMFYTVYGLAQWVGMFDAD